MSQQPKVRPCLWFDGRASEAAEFYVSVFDDARITSVSSISTGPAESGSLVEFLLAGQAFLALDGGPMFTFTPATSWIVTCDTQQEIDYFWERLSEGGSPGRCGWLEDRFGMSWQVTPSILPELMERAPGAVMQAILGMGKIDIAALHSAAGLGVQGQGCESDYRGIGRR